MKHLILSVFLFAALAFSPVYAQLFPKKMPVGVKTYSYYDQGSKYEMEFKDVKGTLDKYNFYNLETSVKAQTIYIVFDRRMKVWRLPLSYNEAMGISDKSGKDPLQKLEVAMSVISPAIREKIE